jgi:methionyl-tRNA formyltransferase
MDDGSSPSQVNSNEGTFWNGLLLPQLDEPLGKTCERAGIPLMHCDSKDVNDARTVQTVRQIAPKIVIYSGYGGQIVGESMLGCSLFLHMHSGWLPTYRGSTTLYYALLRGDDPGVTALILDRTVDTGPMVARRRYPKPYRGMDIDHVYDSAIRADLLVQVMAAYGEQGHLPTIGHQAAAEGTTYFVIHPVLKHLAILSLEPEPR